MRSFVRAGAVAAAAIVGTAMVPRAATAQAVVLGSSASAYCVGSDCSVVRFALKLATQHHFDVIRVLTLDASQWELDGLLRVEDRDGNDLGWAWTGDGSRIELRPNTQLGTEPVFVTVQMKTWSTMAEIFGPLRMHGRGEVRTQDGRQIAEFGGPVAVAATTTTPEPASMMLFGLGLAGVLGVRRRRSAQVE